MTLVVFMRGVNVGGHRTFQPVALAKAMAAFDVVNVGAAGTFVVRKAVSQASLRTEFLRRLPFKPDLMICRAKEVLDLAKIGSNSPDATRDGVRRFVSVMANRPRPVPRLPICQPAGDKWQVQVVEVTGKFALSLWRQQGSSLVYPNEVVEKNFGVPATTRNWNTIDSICEILSSPGR